MLYIFCIILSYLLGSIPMGLLLTKWTGYGDLRQVGSAVVLMKRAPEGTGIIAGGPVRAVVELAGIKNIRTKSLGSNNKTNVVLATMEGLKSLKTPEEVAKARGISVEELLG